MAYILLFIERLYNSIRYNGFYILLSLLFPFIIWKFDAGKEIIVSMTEHGFSLNIGLTLLTFSALSLSVWCVPTLAIQVFQFFSSCSGRQQQLSDANKVAVRSCLYHQLVNVYNGKVADPAGCNAGEKAYKAQLPVRYFAVAPWILFIMTCIQTFLGNSFMMAGLIFMVLCIAALDRWKKAVIRCYEFLLTKNRHTFDYKTFLIRYTLLAITYFTVIFAFVFIFSASKNVPGLTWWLCILNFIFLLLFYSFLLYLENSRLDRYVSKPGSQSLNLGYKVSNINYRVLLVYLVTAIIIFYYCNQYQLIQYISPVVVIVTMATVLIIFFELCFTSQLLLIQITTQKGCQNPDCKLSAYNRLLNSFQHIPLKVYRFALLFAILVIINLYFFSSTNSHRIRKFAATQKEYIPENARASLTGYFESWLKTRNIPNDDSVVFLISGQGGGSRAAAWFFMNMYDLDNRYPDFFKKVFSVSTVSGSSTGANMFLAARYHNVLLKDTAIRNAVADLYGKNYMSSSFYGLMLGDWLESMVDVRKEFPRDRNYHLQKEELNAFDQRFAPVTGRDFFERDFMWSYKDTGRHWPLFLLNTTVVNFGTRGVFSPVQMKDYSIARDLYGEFKNDNCNAGDNIPMVTCVNQSQAFPVLSAYNYMDCVGRLGDGGISENSGCATTLEIYQHLRQYCDSVRPGVRIICLNITNGNLESNFKVSYQKASIFNTVTAAVNSPFDGSETYAYRNLDRQVRYLRNRDTVINCSLDTSITLTRTLSRQSVDWMYRRMTGLHCTLPQPGRR